MPDSRAQQIAQIVRRARLARTWTQAQLAERLDVHPQTVYHIETAKHMPGDELIKKLEEILNVDLSPASLAGQSLIDAVVIELSMRMRELGPRHGMLMATQVMAFIDSWEPRLDRENGHENGANGKG